MTIKCFIQRTGIYQSLIMFVEVNHVTNKRLRRTSETELMLLIRLETVIKPSLKSLDSTNPPSDRLSTNDHCYLPEKRSTNKDHSKAERVIVCEVAKVPRVTSKQLKTFLTFMNPASGEHGETMVCTEELQEERHCSPKTKRLSKDHVDKPEDYWRKDGWNQNSMY